MRKTVDLISFPLNGPKSLPVIKGEKQLHTGQSLLVQEVREGKNKESSQDPGPQGPN